MHFFGLLYLGPYGALRPEFLHALEIDQDYLAHTPAGAGSPPPKKNLIDKIKNRA